MNHLAQQPTAALEPITCKCGAKPVINIEPMTAKGKYWVCCADIECDLETDVHHTRHAAVMAWNKHPNGAYIH